MIPTVMPSSYQNRCTFSYIIIKGRHLVTNYGEGGGYKTGGGGGAREVLHLQKGGAEKVLAMLKGGHNKFLGRF